MTRFWVMGLTVQYVVMWRPLWREGGSVVCHLSLSLSCLYIHIFFILCTYSRFTLHRVQYIHGLCQSRLCTADYAHATGLCPTPSLSLVYFYSSCGYSARKLATWTLRPCMKTFISLSQSWNSQLIEKCGTKYADRGTWGKSASEWDLSIKPQTLLHPML
jgi:hypothetical protein